MNMRKNIVPRIVLAAFVLTGGITTYQSMTNFNAGNFLESAQASYENMLSNNIVYQKVTVKTGKDFLAYLEATLPKDIPDDIKTEILNSDS